MRKCILLTAILLVVVGLMGIPPATIRAQSRKTSFMVFGDPGEKAAYETLVAAFEKAHLEIDVDLLHIPSQSDYRQRLAADLAAGTATDVVLISFRNYARFAEIGALEPVAPYLEKSTLLKAADFYPESIAPYTWNRTLYCIPQNISSLVVYYNKSLFDRANVPYPKFGWTWDEFVQTARALTDGKGQYGLGTEAEFIRVAPFIWGNGGEIVDDPINPTRLTLDTPDVRAGIQWFLDLQLKHKVVPDLTQEQGQDSESRFLNGTLAMYLNSRRVVPTMRTITGFDWDVAALPVGKRPATILHSDAYCMTVTSKDKDAAWTLIEYANSAVGQTIIAETGRTVPSLRAVAESPAFLSPMLKPASSKVWLDVVPYVRPVPILPFWPDIEEAVSAQLEAAYYGQITLDEALAAIKRETDRLFVRQ